MVPLTLINWLSLKTESGGVSFGDGKKGGSDRFLKLLEGLTAGKVDGAVENGSGTSVDVLKAGLFFENDENASLGWLRSMLGKDGLGDAGDPMESLYGMMKDGQSFLTHLKKEFMAGGNCLEDYTVNSEAMAEFSGILVALGFNGNDVEEMVSNLESRSLENPVTLAELFEAASQMPGPDPVDDVAPLLDISTLPVMGDILTQLGLDDGTRRDILTDAIIEGEGLDLKKIAAGIRDAIGDMENAPEITGDVSADLLEKMLQIGLVADTDAASQAPGEALASSDLDELVASFWDSRMSLQELVASAGAEADGDKGRALWSKLAQMGQAASSEASGGGLPGKAGSVSDTGNITLERFAAILEERAVAAEGVRGGTTATHASKSMAERVNGLMEKVASASENTATPLVSSAVSEGDEALRSLWRSGMKRVGRSGSRLEGANADLKNAIKAEGEQNAAGAAKQTAVTDGAQRQVTSNSAPSDLADKFSEALNAAGKDRTAKIPEESNFSMESLARGTKSTDESVSFGKETAGRNLPGYLLNQVSRQIVRLRNAGENELTLQLKPPHLGRMKLNVEHGAGGIRVGIVVESAAARDMLLANAQDLKTALADQGLRLDKIDVDTQTDFGQSMAQADRDRGFGQAGGRKGGWSGASPADEGDGIDTPSENSTGTEDAVPGRLDLVA